MYNPKFRTKRNGVPILSKNEIDDIAEECLKEFAPKALEKPQAIDEDRFLTEYLKLIQDFQFLTHCGIYLGMTVFNDTNKVIVYNPSTNRAEYIKAKGGTVIIDNTLLEEGQEHRYRFTAIHEAGHWILHRKKYCIKNKNPLIYDQFTKDNFKCRAAIIDDKVKPVCEWNDNDSMEWQANYFAAAILMPKPVLIGLCENSRLIRNLDLRSLGNTDVYNDLLAAHISHVFNVSLRAAKVRLYYLGLTKAKVESYKVLIN